MSDGGTGGIYESDTVDVAHLWMAYNTTGGLWAEVEPLPQEMQDMKGHI